MRTWVMKENVTQWPYDMICVQISEDTLLFIHADGGWDLSPIEHGKPTEGYWWEFA